jgi:hypothetical protein
MTSPMTKTNKNKVIFSLFISDIPEPTSSYIKKVQFLLMYMFQREQVFSRADVANYTVQAVDKLFDFEIKTFFWTKHQKTLLDSNPKRVLFTSEFGTGKTILLKAKTKQLGWERHLQHLKNKSKKIESSSGKIFFLVFLAQDALLTLSLKSEMEELRDHVQIVSLTSECFKC